ncbi:MAG: GIY-YIG nuclease family protein [Candidatus Vogelbacteria bacterium]|nr:GIY-YIG nuclease family protein [Candidatus Vogelbacteria bacterium]
MHYVYILKMSNDQFYTGMTDDLRRRFNEHKNGGVVSTNHKRPVKLIFYETFLLKSDATRREKYLKTSKGKSTLKLMLRDYLSS